MTTRKRNEFLDISSSDDEGNEGSGYDSDAAEESKGRSLKRRRMVMTDEFMSGEEEEEEEEEDNGSTEPRKSNKKETDSTPEQQGTTTTTTPDSKPEQDKKKKKKNKDIKPTKNKTGVIYLSTLPPYLRPSALKSMLEARGFAPITRVFLTPAIPTATDSTRRRSNKRKTYTDGWVEFASKKTAKICAETLNATIVGGKKGGWYHDDLWNMKYLRGFKWDDLMEQVQRERSEREARRRVEDSRARKEEKVFLAGVEKGKVLDGIQRKKAEKRRKDKDEEEAGAGVEERQGDAQVRRLFRQNEVKGGDGNAQLAEDTKRVLGKIF